MSNRLKMDKVHAVLALHQQGMSQRKIAKQLAIHRSTVAACLKSKPAKVPTGSAEVSESRSRSHCEPYEEVVLAKLEQGLSAQRIFQDLVQEQGFSHGYDSVKRFVRHLRTSSDLPFRRMETDPGQEAQIDFGQGAPIIDAAGKRRRSHVLRVVLSHSRKGYCEVVERQTTDCFLRAIENAFHHFQGVPRTLVIDNLRAAVTKADWFDPELNPKVQSFAVHYETAFLPTRPRMPRHKGKVERGVDYVQENALKGRTFSSLCEQNEHLWEWESKVADTRIHGTTRKQILRAFEAEQGALLPLPQGRFPCFQEAKRRVHRDGHVALERAFYSVPPEYRGREVWVRWDSRMVRIFNSRMEPIIAHARQEPGRFSTLDAHIASEKRSGVERSATWWLQKVSVLGPHTRDWAAAVVKARGVESVRVMMGLKQLAEKQSPAAVEEACATALSYGAFRLKTLRKLIEHRPPAQQQFAFIEEHPIIRSLETYSAIVASSFGKGH